MFLKITILENPWHQLINPQNIREQRNTPKHINSRKYYSIHVYLFFNGEKLENILFNVVDSFYRRNVQTYRTYSNKKIQRYTPESGLGYYNIVDMAGNRTSIIDRYSKNITRFDVNPEIQKYEGRRIYRPAQLTAA